MSDQIFKSLLFPYYRIACEKYSGPVAFDSSLTCRRRSHSLQKGPAGGGGDKPLQQVASEIALEVRPCKSIVQLAWHQVEKNLHDLM